MIKNCILTHENSAELNTWSSKPPYYTGIRLSASSAYTPCDCVVVYVGQSDNKTMTVIIQYDSNIALKYDNLFTCEVSQGDALEEGSLIGRCNKYLHFELLTSVALNSEWDVKVGSLTYYKQNPQMIAEGKFTFDSDVTSYKVATSIIDEESIYKNLTPYVCTLYRTIADVNLPLLRKIGCSVVIVEGGCLYDAVHMTIDYENPNLDKLYNKIKKSELGFGMLFITKARNVSEARSEMSHCTSIFRHYIPNSGVWIDYNLTSDTHTNDTILEEYITYLTSQGFKDKIGIRCSKKQLKTFTWSKFEDRALLWIVDNVTSLDELDPPLKPSFFKIEG